MNPPSDPPPPPQPKSSRSSTESRLSEFHRTVSRRRCLLGFLAVLLVIGIVCGIAFAAHHYYVAFGGQGWLKRDIKQDDSLTAAAGLYLPFRKIETFPPTSSWPWSKRYAGGNVPFYQCGDQQNSCGSYGQPNICCPVGMFCQPSEFSNSGILCCNASEAPWRCPTSVDKPPLCMESTVECSIETGGGCCPSQKECSPNGCVHVRQPDNSNATSSSSTTSTPSATAVADPSSTTTATNTIGVAVTRTVTMYLDATQTLAKSGEIAQAGSASIVFHSCLPYAAVSVLVVVAGIMGFL